MDLQVAGNRNFIAQRLAADARPGQEADFAIGLVDDIERVSGLDKEQRARLRAVLARAEARNENLVPAEARPVSRVSATLTCSKQSYPDRLELVADHPAIDCQVTLSEQVRVGDLMVSLLGQDNAETLRMKAHERTIFDRMAPLTSSVTLFLDSGDLPRFIDEEHKHAAKFQKDDLTNSGFGFGDRSQVMIVCAVLTKKLKDGDELSPAERELYSRLDTGSARSSIEAFSIWFNPLVRQIELNVTPYENSASPCRLAFGSRLPGK